MMDGGNMGTLILSIFDLLDMVMKGTAAMPFILALALVMGRRAHGMFCLLGAVRLGRFTLLLSIAGLIAIPGNYVVQMAAMNGHNYIRTFFTLPAMHFSVTLGIWIGATLLFWGAVKELDCRANAILKTTGSGYALTDIKVGFWLDLAAAFLFFSTFASSHWPFGGFPAEISQDRVIMAILRNTARNCFMALAPAGALACVFAIYIKNTEKNYPGDLMRGAIRWCALWAFVGYLPHCLQSWGIVLGVGLRGANVHELGLFSQAVGLFMQTGGMLCFAFILLRKNAKDILAFVGLGLFLCSGFLARATLEMLGR